MRISLPDHVDPDRFWDKAQVGGIDECWPWLSITDSDGYGEFRKRYGKTGSPNAVVFRGRAHRIAYELTIGPIPGGLVIDHLCRVRHCVNPAHMEPVTAAENTRRGQVGRHHNGGQRGPRRRTNLTECPHGHPYDEANTYINAKGYRHCRTCRRLAQRRVDARKRAQRSQ